MNSKHRWRRGGSVAVAAAMVLGIGCGKASPSVKPKPISSSVALTAFAGANACQDLEQYLEDTAVLQMRTQLEAMRDGVPSWGWWAWPGDLRGWEFNDAVPVAAPSAAGAPGTTGGAAPAAPTDFTTTNNQVAGVDEADFVKNDGTRAFVLAGDTLHALKTWPAAEMAELGSLKIEGYPRELFLDGTSRALVFSSLYENYPLAESTGACTSLTCAYSQGNAVKVTEVDVSDLAHLNVIKETYVPGYYNSARKVEHAVRIVLSDPLHVPPGFRWSPTWDAQLWQDKARLRAAYDAIIAENERLIRAQTLDAWVPAMTVKRGGVATSVPLDCGAFSRVSAPTRVGQVSVVTLDLTADAVARTTILAEPGEIYASQKHLYIATRHWWWWPAPGQRDATYLHEFDISQPSEAVYLASGEVDGHIVDQFSMDESASGEFRVVTTIQTRVEDAKDPGNWWGTLRTTNRLTVLAQHGTSLDVVGQSPDLAEGERVTASRILGNKGFIVTFRQVDPLFTLDLTDPTKPRVVAELTVPGFSTYLHPLDEQHLLTIGTYIPLPDGGVPPPSVDAGAPSPSADAGAATPKPGDEPATSPAASARATQLAIYDVSDLAHPKQTFTQLVGTAYGSSEAQYEHKAFNYFPAKKLLAIPFADWTPKPSTIDFWSSFSSDLRVFSVDADQGFTPRGAVSMADLYSATRYDGWYFYWQPWVRRSIMADDYVYAISDSGMRVALGSSLATPVATVRFARPSAP